MRCLCGAAGRAPTCRGKQLVESILCTHATRPFQCEADACESEGPGEHTCWLIMCLVMHADEMMWWQCRAGAQRYTPRRARSMCQLKTGQMLARRAAPHQEALTAPRSSHPCAFHVHGRPAANHRPALQHLAGERSASAGPFSRTSAPSAAAAPSGYCPQVVARRLQPERQRERRAALSPTK